MKWRPAFNGQVEYLTSCILNVFSNFVPNKIITCRDKDPPWITEEVKKICHKKAKIYENYVKNGRSDVDKDERSILNKFLQKKKIPLIPPILSNGTFITNVLTLIILVHYPHLNVKSTAKIDNVIFTEHDILSIIRSLNSNKAHGWDDISIRMVKICDESIAYPLKIIFETSLKCGIFPDKWKKANVVPVHKKESKNILKNYRPISLLPVCGKIFEKCIYNSLYSYLESNNILSKFQSGFRKGDSCISQLMAITHEIYSNFDACPSLETRGVFLDISKAFDRVWHDGLLYKLKLYGINGPLIIY